MLPCFLPLSSILQTDEGSIMMRMFDFVVDQEFSGVTAPIFRENLGGFVSSLRRQINHQ